MLYLKKLKNLLQFKKFFYILIIITSLYVYLTISHHYFISKYHEGYSIIEGIITKIQIDGNKINFTLSNHESIIVNYYISDEDELAIFKKYQLGDRLRVQGEINLPSENTNFYLFNYRNYLLSKKIYYVMDASNIELVRTNTNLFYHIKNNILNRIDKLSTKHYLKAFLLGDNSDIEKEILNSYQINGISHLFALSGLHITIFSSIILFIVTKITKNKKISFFVITIFLIFYTFLTGLSPSIIRATLFFLLININIYFKLNIKTINLYILILCLVLLNNPYNIYNNGFLFSYIISFYLILFSDLINKYKNYCVKLFITSFISWCVSIPIMINSYFSVNLISFIYNLFYVPLVTFIILPMSLITFICPLFDMLLKEIITLLEVTSLALSKVTIFTVTLRHVPMLVLILYYILITFIFSMMRKNQYRYIVLLIFILYVHTNYNNLNSQAYVTILDVGQGDCILVIFPHNQCNILIDTGGKMSYIKEKWMQKRNNYSLALSTIIPYLKSEGINKLDYLILSHGDYDHMGESILLVNNFSVDKVIFNNNEYNELEKNLIEILDKKGIKYYKGVEKLNIKNNIIYFLNTGKYNNENDNSNVIYFSYNNYKFLFMGDAGINRERDILDKYNLKNIDFLKVGHHGSDTSSSENFIKSVSPKYALISVGKNNRYGHPKNSILKILSDSIIYRTDKDGSIQIKFNKNGYKINTCND